MDGWMWEKGGFLLIVLSANRIMKKEAGLGKPAFCSC